MANLDVYFLTNYYIYIYWGNSYINFSIEIYLRELILHFYKIKFMRLIKYPIEKLIHHNKK